MFLSFCLFFVDQPSFPRGDFAATEEDEIRSQSLVNRRSSLPAVTLYVVTLSAVAVTLLDPLKTPRHLKGATITPLFINPRSHLSTSSVPKTPLLQERSRFLEI